MGDLSRDGTSGGRRGLGAASQADKILFAPKTAASQADKILWAPKTAASQAHKILYLVLLTLPRPEISDPSNYT